MGPPTPMENEQKTSKVKFADSKIPIEKQLNQKRRKTRRKKQIKYDVANLRRSPRNSRQNIVKSAKSVVKGLFNATKTLISLILTNCPLDPTLRQPTVEPHEDEAIGLLIEEEVEGEQDIKLQQYHHILDLATENMDGEDHYQQYCWKVKKILGQTKRGKHIFLKVLWKPGNISWISLRSLRNHDLHSCVLYALEKGQISGTDWGWVQEFIQNNKSYKK